MRLLKSRLIFVRHDCADLQSSIISGMTEFVQLNSQLSKDYIPDFTQLTRDILQLIMPLIKSGREFNCKDQPSCSPNIDRKIKKFEYNIFILTSWIFSSNGRCPREIKASCASNEGFKVSPFPSEQIWFLLKFKYNRRGSPCIFDRKLNTSWGVKGTSSCDFVLAKMLAFIGGTTVKAFASRFSCSRF